MLKLPVPSGLNVSVIRQCGDPEGKCIPCLKRSIIVIMIITVLDVVSHLDINMQLISDHCCYSWSVYWHFSDPPLDEDDVPAGQWLCHKCLYRPSANSHDVSFFQPWVDTTVLRQSILFSVFSLLRNSWSLTFHDISWNMAVSVKWIIMSSFQNVHCWLTHMPAVAWGTGSHLRSGILR